MEPTDGADLDTAGGAADGETWTPTSLPSLSRIAEDHAASQDPPQSTEDAVTGEDKSSTAKQSRQYNGDRSLSNDDAIDTGFQSRAFGSFPTRRSASVVVNPTLFDKSRTDCETPAATLDPPVGLPRSAAIGGSSIQHGVFSVNPDLGASGEGFVSACLPYWSGRVCVYLHVGQTLHLHQSTDLVFASFAC